MSCILWRITSGLFLASSNKMIFFCASRTASAISSLLWNTDWMQFRIAWCKMGSFKLGECLQYLVPNSSRFTHRHTSSFVLSRLIHMVLRYIAPHSPQTVLSDSAYLLVYFPRPDFVLRQETFLLLLRLAISNWTSWKISLGIIAGWLSVM